MSDDKNHNVSSLKSKQPDSSSRTSEESFSSFIQNSINREDSMAVCSSGDCTGLIPALPSSDAELEAYEEMYRFCTPPETDL